MRLPILEHLTSSTRDWLCGWIRYPLGHQQQKYVSFCKDRINNVGPYHKRTVASPAASFAFHQHNGTATVIWVRISQAKVFRSGPEVDRKRPGKKTISRFLFGSSVYWDKWNSKSLLLLWHKHSLNVLLGNTHMTAAAALKY